MLHTLCLHNPSLRSEDPPMSWNFQQICYVTENDNFFFLIGVHSMQGWTAFTRHGVTRKEAQKRLRIQNICLERNYSCKMSANFGLKATKIIGQRKAFYRQRIPEFSRVRKETVDTDILVTPRKGDRKIMQSIRITSRPPSRTRKGNQLNQFWRTSTKVTPIEKT